jgi:hypothetical protein
MNLAAMTQPMLAEPRQHGIVREGAVSGFLGAAIVALWFLVVDVVAGQPLQTPYALGTALMSALGWPASSVLAPVAIYTVFHVAAFALAGMATVAFLHLAQRDVAVLLGLVMLFVVVEGGFYGLVLVLDITLLGSLAWTQILPANLLATLTMGAYLWWTHPALHGRVEEGLRGTGST